MADFAITIIGGKYKGKKLFAAPLETTRSTKSILKGSFFDTVQFNIIDKTFVEVFGGTGSMGLEALSRGAGEAYFIEKNKKVYDVLIKNCRLIDASKTHTILGDSFERYLPLVFELKQQSKKAYLYFDPPFDIRDGMQDIYHDTLSLIEQTPAEIVEMIVIEHATKTIMPACIGSFKQQKIKKFGKSSLSYYSVA